MEHLIIGLGDLTGLDIIAAAEHPSRLIGPPGLGRTHTRTRRSVAAARGAALDILRRLRPAASSDGRCRADAPRGCPASHAAAASRV